MIIWSLAPSGGKAATLRIGSWSLTRTRLSNEGIGLSLYLVGKFKVWYKECFFFRHLRKGIKQS